MKIRDFGVEIWMNLYENNCEYNLAETCVESLRVEELLEIAGQRDEVVNTILNMQLTYGAIEGSERLRTGIKELYKNAELGNITVTHGAIGANDLVLNTLVEPGDRVISVLPTYQQHYSIPESIGAEVKILKLTPENNFLPDLEELRSYVNENTKLICINNPNNPTGALMDEDFLKEIAEIARSVDAYILSDEVYRGLNHEGESFTASIADIYEKGISTGSMSKTFSLAGLRIGWVCGPEAFIEMVNRRRDYNIISCGMIDEYLAAIALDHKEHIVTRNLEIIRTNKKMLLEWIENEPLLSVIEPKAGTTAFVKYEMDMPSEEFCKKLLAKQGVMLVPGKAMDMEGFLRIGYANNSEIIRAGLNKISEFITTL